MKTKDKSVRNGLILKGFRKQNGITAKELGRSVNRADKTVYHWENGRNIPKDILEKLSSIYGIKFNGVKSTKQNKSKRSKILCSDATTTAASGSGSSSL